MSATNVASPAGAGASPRERRRPRCSVVIPAHDEASVLIDRLGPLVRGLRPGEADIVVVANGCTDNTAEVARRLPGVRVIEIDVAGKIAALNAGDEVVTAFPRIYLDADIALSAPALRSLVGVLDSDTAAVASPPVRFDVTRSTRLVRAFYRVFTRLPYVREGLVGLGVYALSRAGRERFDQFPDVVADDLYVQQLFAPTERLKIEESFVVTAPRRLPDLLNVRTRVARGNRELSRRETGAEDAGGPDTGRALLSLVARSPQLLPSAVVYAAVGGVARRRALRAPAGVAWERDLSSRYALHPTDGAERVLVDGVPIDPLTEEQVVGEVMEALTDRRGGVVVTANVDIHRKLRTAEFADVIAGADLVVPDGMPLVWAGGLAGDRLPERVTGASLIWSLARAGAEHGRRLYLLGAAPGVAAIAADRLVEAVPGVKVAGWDSPHQGFEDRPDELAELVHRIVDAKPDIVFVALGFPRQERLCLVLREHLPEAWFLGCGASIDFVAGCVPRAPQALQALGLEWIYRLLQEPRRLTRRYLVDDIPHAVAMLARSAAAGLRRSSRR